MYLLIKKLIKALIPRRFLFKNELFFRSIYGLLYKGKSHQCNICNNKLSRFTKLDNGDLLCPCCGSLSRNRRLWQLLNSEKSIKGKVLHFSPSRSLYRILKKKEIEYYSTDFEDEFLADYKFDITKIDQPKDKFDIIICYHVLEHITDDIKAMKELYRVLKPNGVIFVQTPFKEGEIYEDYSIISEEDRLSHFGQEDHVRIYSIDGLKKRLSIIGFKVNVKTFEEIDENVYFGFKSPETVLILNK
ncbi:methyltransferase domain-containing protein [Seonamhaeicola sp. MEBiC1930]|uniref:methyltransferase domain-containing protein n=1 Tax=Seonamhaeicola sp. MEBiC01930 TaxID=2976768 RepID=UPI00324FF78D